MPGQLLCPIGSRSEAIFSLLRCAVATIHLTLLRGVHSIIGLMDAFPVVKFFHVTSAMALFNAGNDFALVGRLVIFALKAAKLL